MSFSCSGKGFFKFFLYTNHQKTPPTQKERQHPPPSLARQNYQRWCCIHAFLWNTPSNPTQPLPLPFTEDTYFVGSCDGLACLEDYHSLNLVIWNPPTKETKVVPKSNLSRFSDDYHIKSGIEFGFDAKTSDYKMIRISSLFDSNESDYYEGHVPCYKLSEVYSLSADSWRKVDSQPGLIDVRAIDTYINGITSWEAFDFDDHWEGVLNFCHSRWAARYF